MESYLPHLDCWIVAFSLDLQPMVSNKFMEQSKNQLKIQQKLREKRVIHLEKSEILFTSTRAARDDANLRFNARTVAVATTFVAIVDVLCACCVFSSATCNNARSPKQIGLITNKFQMRSSFQFRLSSPMQIELEKQCSDPFDKQIQVTHMLRR